MEITEMIMVTENLKGTEFNSLMNYEDYLALIGAGDFSSMKELAATMVELGRTLGDKEVWQEIYVAANKTINARYCADGKQLAQFLQGFYNDKEQEWYFEVEACSPQCLEKLKTMGMNTKGWISGDGMHYTRLEEGFAAGQILHNFNSRDYRVMECLSQRNLLLMDVDSGSFSVAIGAAMYARSPSGSEPTKDNTTTGVEWDHGIYLSATPSDIDFRRIRQEYGMPERIETVSDYRSYLRKQFRLFHTISQDELAEESIRSAAVNAMYEKFGTGREDVFSDRLEDGKYDSQFRCKTREGKTR